MLLQCVIRLVAVLRFVLQFVQFVQFVLELILEQIIFGPVLLVLILLSWLILPWSLQSVVVRWRLTRQWRLWFALKLRLARRPKWLLEPRLLELPQSVVVRQLVLRQLVLRQLGPVPADCFSRFIVLLKLPRRLSSPSWSNFHPVVRWRLLQLLLPAL